MSREVRIPKPVARISCDIGDCAQFFETDQPGIDRVQFEVLRRAAARGWALWDGKSVCPHHVRRIVLEATSQDADRDKQPGDQADEDGPCAAPDVDSVDSGDDCGDPLARIRQGLPQMIELRYPGGWRFVVEIARPSDVAEPEPSGDSVSAAQDDRPFEYVRLCSAHCDDVLGTWSPHEWRMVRKHCVACHSGADKDHGRTYGLFDFGLLAAASRAGREVLFRPAPGDRDSFEFLDEIAAERERATRSREAEQA